MNEEELARLVEQMGQPKRRGLTRGRAKALATLGIVLVGGLALDAIGVDGHLAILGLAIASPVLFVGLAMFLAHTWGQNYTSPSRDGLADLDAEPADLANPGQPDLASEPVSRPVRLARPASQPAVTVTVHPLPSRPTTTYPLPALGVGEPEYATRGDDDGDE